MKTLHTKTQNTRITNSKGNIWIIKSDEKRQKIRFFFPWKVYIALNLWLYIEVVVVQASFVRLWICVA